MHNYQAYMQRIFKMPTPNKTLQNNIDSLYQQLSSDLSPANQQLLLLLLKQQTYLQEDCCIRSFIQGYELAVGIDKSSV